ncbi:MAG TPA: alpha/beta-hydrolase family protein [Actinomycetes bacterium]|nr:alpha/beta-hydrolase family protein [Actinomycetes bacterium]
MTSTDDAPSDTADEPDARPSGESPPDAEPPSEARGDDEPKPVRERWLTLTYPGLVGAVVMFALALTPSLLPRPWMYEGLVAGVGAIVGYAFGVLVWWAVRKVWKRPIQPRVARAGWWLLLVIAPLVMIAALIAAHRWQNQVLDLVGEPENPKGYFLYIFGVSLVVFVVFLLIARGIRWVTRRIAGLLGRVVPVPLAQTIAVIGVIVLLYWLVTGVAFDAAVKFADNVYESQNAGTPEGVTQPTSSLRSGGAGSVVPWDSLGYQGRGFIGGGPTASEISQVTGEMAMDPIRVYAGLDSAPTADGRAELVVRELHRTGAFDRDVLVVASATGTGWLEPAAVDSLEYLWGGDTAIASIQYSFLPSWISFLVDKERAADAGQELFDAVYAEWSQLPAKDRPQLIAYGLSLGSYAGQSAFASPVDMASRTDGALWLGSPSFSEPHGEIEAERDSGSPQWRPVYEDGRTVRFGPSATEFAGPTDGWALPRVAYLQHANDPVVWWDPELLLERPDWLAEPPGPDRSPEMRWIPVVTFLQVTVDQFFGTSVPDLQGHNYGGTMVDAWQSVIPAEGWTTTELDNLQKLIDSQPDD